MSTDSLRQHLIDEMRAVFAGDPGRVSHALDVLRYSEDILAAQDGACDQTVRAAAILHDIGIAEAERKYGSSTGRYQEAEGPPIARVILAHRGVEPAVIDHVCEIIANHHSDAGIDTPEFRIVWDADWLVNMPEAHDTSDKAAMSKFVRRVFKTERGLQIAERLFT